MRSKTLWVAASAAWAVTCLAVGCSNPPLPAVEAGADAGDAALDVKPDRPDVVVPPVDGGSCAPGPVTGFVSSWTPPTPAQDACSGAQIDQFAADCLDPNTATTQKCQAFENMYAKCSTCLITGENAASYGVAIQSSNGVLTLNVGGCLALTTGDASVNGCGAKYEAVRQCDGFSCDTNCPLPDGDNAAFQAYLKCLQGAEGTVCKSVASARCADPDGGPAAACKLGGGSFTANFKALAPIFCSSGG
jgi:hypothetical protein